MKIYSVLLFIVTFSISLQATNNFDKYFQDKTMRIDYYHSGNADSENIVVDHIYMYDTWAGSLVNLVDDLNNGAYYYKIYDAESGKLIYTKGFDSYFKEYQVSSNAIAGKLKTFHESAIIPNPKKKIIFVLEKRSNDGGLTEVYRREIDPSDISILIDEGKDPTVEVITALSNGDPHLKADIAIIAEGYTERDREKFKSDLKRFSSAFFNIEPLTSRKKSFNIYGVFKPSAESGADEPRAGVYKNTAISSTFNSLGSERYLLTEDNKALRDIASHVPYDALYIMVNHSRYGGGGIYNFFCTFTSDNIFSEYLMVHEFGHSFFGLADEYYTSSTAYNDFYSPDYEPSEPNITALKDQNNLKWKHLITESIDIPTPWEKEEFDKTDITWQKEREKLNNITYNLQRDGASQEEVDRSREDYDKKSLSREKEVQNYLSKSEFAGKVGAFEGAGYVPKGLYRSSVNCIMFTRTNFFCPVCQEAMIGIIEWYSN